MIEILLYVLGGGAGYFVVATAKARLPRLKERVDEILPGVTKPSTTLAHMIAAKIIQTDFKPEFRRRGSNREYSLKVGNNFVEYDRAYSKSLPDVDVFRDIATTFGVSFSEEEKLIIKKALVKAAELQGKRDVAEAAAKSQEAAIKAIERFMGIG